MLRNGFQFRSGPRSLNFATVLVQRQSTVLVQRQFPIIYSDVPPQAEVVSSTPQVLAHAYEAEMMLSVRCTAWTVVCLQQSELDSMVEEVQRWRQECNNVEMMRSNALDALRLLETEVTQLQDADIQLKQMKDEYNRLRGQVRMGASVNS